VSARLALEDLAVGYRGRRVCGGVTLDVAAGEVLCLLGPNGGGKTTLFKTVLGLLPPLAGTVAVDGAPTAGWSARRRARAFGYVPQSGSAQFGFTIAEMVLMGRTAHRGPFAAPARQDRRIADDALETLGIAHLAARDWLRVSGGERQLALIARALAQQPAILVLDEPTASLDFGNQLRVLDQVRRLAGHGLAVVLSTHHPEQAFACADRVAMLHDGGLLTLGAPADVITPATMRTVYGVEIEVLPVGGRGGLRVCVPRAVGGDAAVGRRSI
jgi:iron complex transport system ATP-binding protein